VPDPERTPNPIGLTAAAFARAYPTAKWGPRGAYRRLFRDGVTQGALVAPIVHELRSESPEGEVIKFVQDLRSPSQREGAEAGWSIDSTRLPSEVESVLIPMIGRAGRATYTLCVSSQIGCAMGCTFCETAQMGLIRSLTPAEIVGQWFAAAHVIGIRPKNIVFMGMGEPLDNLDNVLAAIEVLTDHNGAHVAMNKITVSTVGRIDGIRRLTSKIHEPGWHRLNLAVSVNAPNDRIRSQIMPINRAMPMSDLREVLLGWPKYGGAKICIEYVLIPGVNNAPEHARELAGYVRPLPACVNVIPYNPRRGSPWPAPTEERVAEFLAWLTDAGAYCKRRRTKGRDMMGACGQLGNPRVRKRRLVPLTASAGNA
jgi:23S rRNA (adenine2503-C2)-methyltransferase